MSPEELRRVLDEANLHQRNKDTFFVLSFSLLIMAGLIILAIIQFVLKKRVKMPSKHANDPAFEEWFNANIDRKR